MRVKLLQIMVGLGTLCAAAFALLHQTNAPTWKDKHWSYLSLKDNDGIYQSWEINSLPKQSPEMIEMLALVEKIDSYLRNNFASEMQEIPKPRILVTKVNVNHAFVMPMKRVCYETKVQLHSNILPTKENTLERIRVNENGELESTWAPCEKRYLKDTDFLSFVDWFNGRFPQCTLSFDKNLQLTGKCSQSGEYNDKSIAERIEVETAPNLVIVSENLFTLVKDPEQRAAVIAHELAHYYRAHVLNLNRYDYCYRVPETPQEGRPPEEPSLKPLCERMKRAKSNGSNDFIPEAIKQRLGYYTFEQEADEMGTEILFWIGIPPQKMVESLFKLGRLSEVISKPSSSSFNMDKCEALYKSDWKENGLPVWIPVGDYKNPHHSWCFRAYNIDREIKAHGYLPR